MDPNDFHATVLGPGRAGGGREAEGGVSSGVSETDRGERRMGMDDQQRDEHRRGRSAAANAANARNARNATLD